MRVALDDVAYFANVYNLADTCLVWGTGVILVWILSPLGLQIEVSPRDRKISAKNLYHACSMLIHLPDILYFLNR